MQQHQKVKSQQDLQDWKIKKIRLGCKILLLGLIKETFSMFGVENFKRFN